jgi:SAM-dependent methyltransferase
MQGRKLDFGSGHKPRRGFLTCDLDGYCDYYVIGGRITAPDGHFSVIRASNVIHHIKDLDGLAREFLRCLAPGGLLYIIEPHKDAYEANKFLDRLWYRVIAPRPDIWWSETYRDWSEYFSKHFVLNSKARTKHLEVTTFRKSKQ